MDNKYGEGIKHFRLMNKLTQKEIAQEVGCTNNMISNYEIGARTPTIKTLLKLADYYEISVYDLIGVKQRQYKFKNKHVRTTI